VPDSDDGRTSAAQNYATFVPESEINMALSFPNYTIIILYGLNPKRVGLQASAGRIQVVTVTSCDPFNQRAPRAGML